MDKRQKMDIAKEMLTNFDMTKEQYLEACKLIDDLDLQKMEDWTDTLESFDNK